MKKLGLIIVSQLLWILVWNNYEWVTVQTCIRGTFHSPVSTVSLTGFQRSRHWWRNLATSYWGPSLGYNGAETWTCTKNSLSGKCYTPLWWSIMKHRIIQTLIWLGYKVSICYYNMYILSTTLQNSLVDYNLKCYTWTAPTIIKVLCIQLLYYFYWELLKRSSVNKKRKKLPAP